MGLFKGKLNAQKVFDSAASGIDALFFTKEEKATYSKQIADSQMEFVKQTISENSARSITRRYLSIGIMFVFLLLILMSVIVYPFDENYAQYVFNTAKELFELTMMVAAFFFGGYMVKNNILSQLKDKK